MPSRNQTIRHIFNGGWATDFGQVAEVGVGPDGLVGVPFLIENKNNTFELDGGTRKIGGTARVNSTQYKTSEMIGLFDYWKGEGAAASQKIIVVTGQFIAQQTLDAATFTDLVTDWTDDAAVSLTTFDDLLIIANDASDAPISWDQSTLNDPLTGSPPTFSFSATHKNRLWAAGVATTKSRLFYSTFVDPENWTGSGSGFIDIDPGDGDEITGIASHKDNLWVFKGPHHGSIHRIVGSAPTGGDSFGRQTFVTGLGAAGHNSLFKFKDDLGFMWSDGSIHSLNATAAFGDFNESALSRPINGWLRDHINGNRLKFVWSANDSVRGFVLFTIPIDTSTQNNHHLLMDYRFDPVRWAHWDAFGSGAVAIINDSGVPALFDCAGSGATASDGFVRRLMRTDRNIDGTGSIASRADTPFLSYGTPHNFKQLERASVGIDPKGTYDLTFGWQRDANSEQTQTVSQGSSGDLLDTTFVLDSSVLGSTQFLNRFLSLEEGGEFRAIKYSVRNNAVNEDLEVHSIASTIRLGADSGEN